MKPQRRHEHAPGSPLLKIDTEDEGISFPVGERSTLKGYRMLGFRARDAESQRQRRDFGLDN